MDVLSLIFGGYLTVAVVAMLCLLGMYRPRNRHEIGVLTALAIAWPVLLGIFVFGG